jgi:hypothetical protein
MTRMMLLAGLVWALCSSSARAQGNRIVFFADEAMSICELVDDGLAIRAVHVFLLGSEPSTGAGIAAPKPACWSGATWVGDIVPVTEGGGGQYGNSQTVLSIAFGACLSPPLHVATINYFTTGVAGDCCGYNVVPGVTRYVACVTFDEVPAAPAPPLIINPNETCRCGQPVAAEASTWGRVKSLYRPR